LYILH
jgi:hypothetical protein